MSANSFFSLQGPLDVLPAGRQVRAANFGGFLEFVSRRGGDPRWILEHKGIDAAAIGDADYHVDAKSLADVFEYCSTYFDDSLFGLRMAQVQEPDVFGPVTAVCRAATTFRDAVNSFIAYVPVIHCPNQVLELVTSKDTAELRYSNRSDIDLDFVNAQSQYQGILLILKLFRQIGGRPSYVNLTCGVRRKDIATFEDVLGCPVHSKATANAIAFPIGTLDQPIPNSSRQLFRLLSSYLDCVKTASRTTIVARVQDYVRGSLSSGNCSIERCAQKLGISARTLQVQLKAYGLRFSTILEEQRVEMARGYLGQDDLPLDDIAYLLGYAEQSSFGRAFKRWTGATPQGYRETKVSARQVTRVIS